MKKNIRKVMESTWFTRGFTEITEERGRNTDISDRELVYSSINEGREIWINPAKQEVWLLNVPNVLCNNGN